MSSNFNANKYPLFDTIDVTYDDAGTRKFNGESSFFSVARGSGGKTFTDTNLLTPGQLPIGSLMSVRRIMAQILPGVIPSQIAAPGLTADNFINDVWELFKKGNLAILGSDAKVITRIPLSLLPPSTGMSISAFGWEGIADAANTGKATQYASIMGEAFDLSEEYELEGGKSFGATLEMPAGLVVPSNTACKVKLIYQGIYVSPKQ
jgi:hypothetical protein